MRIATEFKALLLLTSMSAFINCTSTSPNAGLNASFPNAEAAKNRIPMAHRLMTDDWETLDSIWGIFVTRHIFVNTAGLSLRVKRGLVEGKGQGTPSCVEYGGLTSVFLDQVQAKGNTGEEVSFLQGVGSC